MKSKNIIALALFTALILMIPVVGSRVMDGWNWTAFDFVFAGTLIFGTGLAYQLIAGKGGTAAYRAAVSMALSAMFLLVWINGAVGIIGSEDNPANLLYGAVVAVIFLGSIIVGFKAQMLSRVLFLAAVIQFLVPVIALILWRPDMSPGVLPVFALNGFFVMLLLGSGLLFRSAARDRLMVGNA